MVTTQDIHSRYNEIEADERPGLSCAAVTHKSCSGLQPYVCSTLSHETIVATDTLSFLKD